MTPNEQLKDLHGSAFFRADRISRAGKLIEQRATLGAESAEAFGCDHVGLFVESSGNLSRMSQKLQFLDKLGVNSKWIVCVSTCDDHWRMYNLWRNLDADEGLPVRNVPAHWQSERIIFSTLESLSDVADEAVANNTQIACLVLIDLQCFVHKARGDRWTMNDRPQHVVDCRAKLAIGDWSPPLIVFIEKLARSVDTETMRVAYSLNAWQYFDGRTFTFNVGGSCLSSNLVAH